MFFLLENVLKYINTSELLAKVTKTMEKGETNRIMEEKEPVLKNTEEITANSGLNQHGENLLLTEYISFSDTYCDYLKETNNALAGKKCRKKSMTYMSMLMKMMERIFCAAFVSKLKLLFKVK